jgi:endonuclease/exonuclease/phosphatase family metal-dependent hydrolase
MSLRVATFNVLNLFDPTFGPKIEEITRVVREADADVVGLQEIGSADALEAVRARLDGYAPAVLGTADARGIACALLSRRPIVRAGVHTASSLGFPVFQQGDPAPFGDRIPLRRGVVHARIDGGDLGEIELLVAHLKSGRPRLLRTPEGEFVPAVTGHARAESLIRSVVWRAAEGLYLRRLVDELFAKEEAARVFALGDFNDVAGSLVLRVVEGEGEKRLVSVAAGVAPERRFSAIHGGTPVQIDHILVSTALAGRVHEARFLNEKLRDHGPYIEEPGPASIDSDHAPLVVELR